MLTFAFFPNLDFNPIKNNLMVFKKRKKRNETLGLYIRTKKA